jgi:hypothetical protein
VEKDLTIDWIERPLGYADTPTHITCRKCHLTKPATALHYQPKDYGIRWQTTCLACAKTDPYRRSTDGRLRTLRHNPGLDTPALGAQIAGIADVVREAKSTALKAAHGKRANLYYVLQWKGIHKVIATRRDMLNNNLFQGKHRNSGLYYAMVNCPAIREYIDVLLDTYRAILGRIRRPADWFEMVGERGPPAAWVEPLKKCLAYDKRFPDLFQQTEQRKGMPPTYVYQINPFVLATHAERDRVRALDPASNHDDPHTPRYWSDVLNMRANGPLKNHIYPMDYPSDELSIEEQTPDWLRPFNGTVAPRTK